MQKRLLSLFLAILFLAQIFPLSAFATGDEGSPKHIPRVVSIVFDDSGSMYENTDRWAYTSYAMQAFAAMMGKEDVLYVSYLNGPKKVKADLSDGGKSKTVSSFQNIMFGGGTSNHLQEGADCLIQEFGQYKTNAKYYLVVIADGELDSGLGALSDRVREVDARTKATLTGADYETVYFSMKEGDSAGISGITSYYAAKSDEIVNALKTISADIMGRTAVSHTVSGDSLSFTLQYPALSIAVFSQKQNGNFDSFRAGVKKDGKALSCQVGNYSVKSPEKIIKNPQKPKYEEKYPADPPAGVVSLISNGERPLEKGKYTIDLSGFSLRKEDIVVLVEPAVRIGCKYRLNKDDDTLTFEELKKRVSEGDTVTVQCALYELNPDGSLGDPVPTDVLSPEYKILVNGKNVGSSVAGQKNAYSFQVTKDFENQDMRVEAVLKGYQPFVIKETFGKLNVRLKPGSLPEGASQVSLTKPLWKKWSAGKEGVSFELERADSTVLDRVAVEVGGCEGLPEGVASSLKDVVRIEGNKVVYAPKSSLSFSQLPESFQVSLKDLQTAEVVLKKTVKVIRPQYRFETENELAELSLPMEQLKSNRAAVTFTLTVDYDGKGKYVPVSESDCEDEIKITLSSGDLTGEVQEEAGLIRFVPQYDESKHKDTPLSKIVGKTHLLKASATVDGKEIASEEVGVSVSSAAYRLEVDNQIKGALSLDTVKTNKERVIFRILADYEGDGTFGPLADWDTGVLDRIKITSGDLPGKTEPVFEDGTVVGKAFIPQYDENNNNGIPFTKVAGKKHLIKATVMDLSAEARVEVLAPDYEIQVRKDGIRVTDVKLRKNKEGVQFLILRDGRTLSKEELEGLAPYELSFSEKQPWMKLDTEVAVAEDGTAYLTCIPGYNGWSFPSSWCWNWWCLFAVKKGDMHITLTLGEDVANAAVTVATSQIAWIIFLIILALLLLLLWIVFCCATRIRFLRGTFYKVTFRRNGNGLGYAVSVRTPQNANKNGLFRYLLSMRFLIPFSEQSTTVVVGTQRAKFKAIKSAVDTFSCRSYPYSDGEANAAHFNKGHLSRAALRAILNRDTEYLFDDALLQGIPLGDSDRKMDSGACLVETGSNKLVFFITKSDEKELRERRNARPRNGAKRNREKAGISKNRKTRKPKLK